MGQLGSGRKISALDPITAVFGEVRFGRLVTLGGNDDPLVVQPLNSPWCLSFDTPLSRMITLDTTRLPPGPITSDQNMAK